jgi:hypothetical protein
MPQAAEMFSKWDALDWVLAQNARDLLERRYDLEAEIVSWFKSLSMFREAQRELLILKDPTTDDLKDHRALIAILIAEGERLLAKLLRASENRAAAISAADLQAAVEHLYDTQAVWHTEMPEQRKAEILRGLFHGQES